MKNANAEQKELLQELSYIIKSLKNKKLSKYTLENLKERQTEILDILCEFAENNK